MAEVLTQVGITGIPAMAILAAAWVVSRTVERTTARRAAVQDNLLRQVEARLEARLAARTALDVNLRDRREKVYAPLWSIGELVSRWPRNPDLTYPDLRDLHRRLRDWYYVQLGGMWLSTPAREAYGRLQEELDRVCRTPRADPVPPDGTDYECVMTLFSGLRTQLTEDLQSRVRSVAEPLDMP